MVIHVKFFTSLSILTRILISILRAKNYFKNWNSSIKFLGPNEKKSVTKTTIYYQMLTIPLFARIYFTFYFFFFYLNTRDPSVAIFDFFKNGNLWRFYPIYTQSTQAAIRHFFNLHFIFETRFWFSFVLKFSPVAFPQSYIPLSSFPMSSGIYEWTTTILCNSAYRKNFDASDHFLTCCCQTNHAIPHKASNRADTQISKKR